MTSEVAHDSEEGEAANMAQPIPKHEMSPEGQTLHSRLESDVSALYNLVDERTDELKQDIAALLRGQTVLEKRTGRLEDGHRSLKDGQKDLQRSVKSLESRFTSLESRFTSLETGHVNLTTKVDDLTGAVARIEHHLGTR